MDARQSILTGIQYKKAHHVTTGALNASLRRDHETWWSQWTLEMKCAAAMKNSSKMFHLIRHTVEKH